jgi:hypothetical protein
MAASRQDLSEWFDEGVSEGATHMIVVCDTFDWEDYPVFVKGNVESKIEHYRQAPMQKIMEVYNLSISKQEQMAERRVWNV